MMNLRETHPYHVVDNSPWPITSSFSALVFALGLIMKFNHVNYSHISLTLGIILVTLSAFLWWSDVTIEGTYQGKHSKVVAKGLKIGIILFFVSECCLFASFFWAYFHASLSPNIELGSQWPPEGITTIDPFGLPLANLIILLSSGAFLTYSHEKLLGKDIKEARIGLIITILLGATFLGLQLIEFSVAPFSVADGAYGSSFFILTTCHMAHVIIGTSFLGVALSRLPHYTVAHNLGLEAAIWYWHLVDIIYLFVFGVVYWWGSL